MAEVKLRKVFNKDNMNESKIVEKINGSFEYPITACGCLFRYEDNLLLIKYQDVNWPLLDDFGGRIDLEDDSVVDAIIREVTEETNNVISVDMLKNYLSDPYYKKKYYYTPLAKYYFVVVDLDQNGYNNFHNADIFGKIEYHDNIERTINWYKFSDVKDKLSVRMNSNLSFMEDMKNLIILEKDRHQNEYFGAFEQ